MSNLILKKSIKHGVENSFFFNLKNDGWNNLIITLFEGIVIKCIGLGKTSDREILEIALLSNISELSKFLEGTEEYHLIKDYETVEACNTLFSCFRKTVEENKWRFIE